MGIVVCRYKLGIVLTQGVRNDEMGSIVIHVPIRQIVSIGISVILETSFFYNEPACVDVWLGEKQEKEV
jgi:hypothetical protein